MIQCASMNHALKNFGPFNKWMDYFDVDEYFQLNNTNEQLILSGKTSFVQLLDQSFPETKFPERVQFYNCPISCFLSENEILSSRHLNIFQKCKSIAEPRDCSERTKLFIRPRNVPFMQNIHSLERGIIFLANNGLSNFGQFRHYHYGIIVVRINSDTCNGKSQYDQCSTNSACGCLYRADSDDMAICGFLWVTCSELVSCESLNNTCYEPNHICIRHPRCHSLPVCYPLSMSDHQMCPQITKETTTVTTSIRTTTTTPIPQDCSDSNLITFDTITSEPVDEIPSDYIGLQWKNFYIMNLTAFPSYYTSGFYTALQSGYIAYNKKGSTMTISSSPPYKFNLYSFIATSAIQNQLRLTMIGERSSKVWYSATYPLYTHWPQLIELNYLNIDKITFSTTGSSEFAMENLCISISSLTTTVEPTTT
ncbi:unnamed protein product [Rotaria sp. Silwood1]|nr:unnamed protein product [Rotaria sp. Silwood1]CAF1229565.1 unnamed protein product [Rotaria sp. Silwood1]CAF4850569.1 unnamed protein product [Rotaria sp. Silwood1]